MFFSGDMVLFCLQNDFGNISTYFTFYASLLPVTARRAPKILIRARTKEIPKYPVRENRKA